MKIHVSNKGKKQKKSFLTVDDRNYLQISGIVREAAKSHCGDTYKHRDHHREDQLTYKSIQKFTKFHNFKGKKLFDDFDKISKVRERPHVT